MSYESTALKHDNLIFTNIKNAVWQVCQNVIRPIGQTTPSEYPYIEVMLLSAPDFANDLEGNDTGAIVAYQTETASNDTYKYEKTKKIADKVYSAFKKMGFSQVEMRSVKDTGDPNVFRIVQRFQRYIGSGDEIPKL